MNRICSKILQITLFATLLFFNKDILAQEFLFSQHEHTNLNINPALLTTEGYAKISILYHQNDLWKELKMKNMYFSFTSPVRLIKNESFPQAFGLSVTNNNYGSQGLANLTNISLAFTQSVKISSLMYLSAGLKASYKNMNSNSNFTYTTGSQWVDGYGYDPLVGINEDISTESRNIFSVGAGMNMQIKKDNETRGNIGFSANNLNKPVFSFLNEDVKTGPFYIAHANLRVYRYKNLSFSPRAMFIYQDINILSVGMLTGYSFKSNNPFLLIKECDFQVGLDYRHNHSGIVNVAVELKQYMLGVSYSFGINDTHIQTNYNSNFEISLAFKFNKKNNKRYTAPKEYQIGETRLIFNPGNPLVNANNNTNSIQNVNNYNSDSIVVTGGEYKVKLREDFKFKFNDASLTQEAMNYIDGLVIMLKQNSSLKIEVIGHTDDVGTKEANHLISEQRAKVVVDYLNDNGIKRSRLKHTAKGMSEPLVPNSNEVNRSKNRRVEFVIYNE